MPLSDGYHILFTDPQTGTLFIGCDAPFDGPTKLTRKIMFVPPPVHKETPRLYTSVFDRWGGVRILVAFGDEILLYSVPSGVCDLSREEQKAESRDVYSTPPFCHKDRALDHWLNWWNGQCITNHWNMMHPIWPITVHGSRIATMRDVCQLAIHAEPELTVWAFTMDARCKIWRLNDSADPVVRSNYYLCQSGMVHEDDTSGRSGRLQKRSVSLSPSTASLPTTPMVHPSRESTDEGPVILDGLHPETPHSTKGERNCSQQPLRTTIPKALSVEKDKWVSLLDVRDCDARFERNGDVTVEPRR